MGGRARRRLSAVAVANGGPPHKRIEKAWRRLKGQSNDVRRILEAASLSAHASILSGSKVIW